MSIEMIKRFSLILRTLFTCVQWHLFPSVAFKQEIFSHLRLFRLFRLDFDWLNKQSIEQNKQVSLHSLSHSVIPQKCRKMLFYGFAWLLGHLCRSGLEQTSGLSRFYHHVSNPEGQEIKVTWCAAMLKWTCLIWEGWDQAWLRVIYERWGPSTRSPPLRIYMCCWLVGNKPHLPGEHQFNPTWRRLNYSRCILIILPDL